MNTSSGTRRWARISRWLALVLAVGLFSTWLARSTLVNLELAAGDLLFQLRGGLPSPDNTLIVAIDDASFTQNGLQWPWPRDYFARIVNRVAAGHPKVIGIDVFFYEASQAADDQALGKAIHDAGNVVVVNHISSELQAGLEISHLNRPIPEVDEAAAALGLTNFSHDSDGSVRRLLAFQSYNGKLYYSLPLQVARLFRGDQGFDLVSSEQVNMGSLPVTLEDRYLRINYRGPQGTIPAYSAYQVADGLVDPGKFAGKIVLIGVTSESLHDSYPTPFGSQPPMPGIEINANAIETILNSQYIRPAPGWAAPVLAVIAALVGVTLALRLRPLVALVAVVVLIALYFGAAWLTFGAARLLLPVVPPVLGIVLMYVTGTSLQLYEVQRKRAEIRALFERYVAPAAIDQMLAQPETYASGGRRKEVTILFSDIRGFTTLSEGLSPDDVVVILNEYLAAMTEIIFKHEGAIDKFEGDAILAIWNAPLDVPDHATKAVECAVEMIERLEQLQTMWAQKSEAPLRIGVGVNTGPAFVGNIGSARRMDYTVIGDTVNLASRLQDLTKGESVPILFGEATRERLRPGVSTRFVTTAQVKGRTQTVNVYTVAER